MKLIIFIILLKFFFLSGCSSTLFEASHITSEYTEPGEGVFYALPRGYVSLTIERKVDEKKVKTLEVTMTEPEFSPDPEHIYLLKYNQTSLSSDNVKIAVNEKGLISTVVTTTTDPVPAAIKEFSNFVVGVSKSGITTSAASDPSPALISPPDGSSEIDPGPFKVKAVFDPAKTDSDASYRNLVNFLGSFGVSINVLSSIKDIPSNHSPNTIENNNNTSPATTPNIEINNKAITNQCKTMICYRFVLPYKIIVSDPEVAKTQAEAIVLLPNEGPIAGIEIVRRSLVENKFDLAFTNGILTKADYDDPSAIIAALNIPIDILKAIFSAPSALFQFKVASDVGELTAQKQLLDLQKQLAETQLALLKAEAEIEQINSDE